MLSAADNQMLTRSGGGTPMGDLFRRFWIPLLLSEELPEPDCPPVRVKVMGDDYVAFRDTRGRVGVIEPHCAHRGANLFFGRNEDGGLRCIYHGWKFDVDGRCVDMPSVPAGAGYQDKVGLKALPVREWGDFVWAYLGPAQQMPELPRMEFALVPPSHRFVSKKLQQCNWAQACEGGLDTTHFTYLHMAVGGSEDELMKVLAGAEAGAQRDRARWLKNDGMPVFSVHLHAAGIVLGASRKADGSDLYWRISQFLMPCHGLAPNAFPGDNYHGQSWVPIDDDLCWVYCYSWNPERPITAEERAKFRSGHSVHATLGPGYVPVRNRGNDYLIDRVEQKHRTFTGIQGVSEQDAAVQDSQGFIVDRTREHLGPTDLGIVHFRRLMLQAAKDLAEGTEPPHAAEPDSYNVRSGGIVCDGAKSLEQVMVERFGDRYGRVGAAQDRRRSA